MGVGRSVAWVSDHLGAALIGDESWGRIKHIFYVVMLTLALSIVLWFMDRVARPFIAVGMRLMPVWKWIRGIPEEVTVLTPAEMDWRGPETAQPPDNEFFRDHIRGRNRYNRFPNDLVIQRDGELARITRQDERYRTVNRFGQIFDRGGIVAATSTGFRRELEDAPGAMLCLSQPVTSMWTNRTSHAQKGICRG